jgi:hypothetical protein
MIVSKIFASDEFQKAKYYPQDGNYLLEFEETVCSLALLFYGLPLITIESKGTS